MSIARLFFILFCVACFMQASSGGSIAADKEGNPSANPAVTNKGATFEDAVKAEKKEGNPAITPAQLSGGSAAAVAPFAEVKIDKASGDNAYTVQEIFARSKELQGKTVRVRGKVVKFNGGIMGRNWIHIQDGSGNPLDNTHDLVATSQENATVGEVVTVEGKLAANKDFGAGYAYAAIIEQAKLIK